NLLSNSVWSEVSKLAAVGRKADVIRIKRRLTIVTVVVAGAVGVAMSAYGERFYTAWTGKHVVFDSTLFDILLLSMVANSLWQSASIFVIAINRHIRFAFAYYRAFERCAAPSRAGERRISRAGDESQIVRLPPSRRRALRVRCAGKRLALRGAGACAVQAADIARAPVQGNRS
ncbi:hypothetical protein ACFXGD_31000, partial [Streptomyces albidoflavus]